MSVYPLGGRAGWPATSVSGLTVDSSLRASGAGTYVSSAFDGGVAGCVWDRLRFDPSLPAAATSITFSTYTADVNRGDAAIAALDPSEWSTPVTIAGPFGWRSDTIITANPGRYLWLRVQLTGVPGSAAELHRLDVSFPRNTSLRMLPAIYATDAGGRSFNERLLSLFDAMRDEVKGEIRTLGSVIDPRTTDAATKRDFLDWLGAWFDMELYRAWPVERRRAVIHHAGELFRLRGTARGIERFVELALGRRIVIVESFTERSWWFAQKSYLGCAVLFGPGIVNRAALDGTDLLSTKTIDSVPTPMLDPFASRANRMTVYVPSYAEPTQDELTMLERVIETQKPAHVAVCIVITSPNARLGVTARLGLDSMLGTLSPPALLAGTAPPRIGVNAIVGGLP
ncbi:MAG TPA: phage tail protein [Candidatus Acidoferrales bacterium]|nr:phage tail protein [Candidatus Acidoferrales bacterium]